MTPTSYCLSLTMRLHALSQPARLPVCMLACLHASTNRYCVAPDLTAVGGRSPAASCLCCVALQFAWPGTGSPDVRSTRTTPLVFSCTSWLLGWVRRWRVCFDCVCGCGCDCGCGYGCGCDCDSDEKAGRGEMISLSKSGLPRSLFSE